MLIAPAHKMCMRPQCVERPDSAGRVQQSQWPSVTLLISSQGQYERACWLLQVRAALEAEGEEALDVSLVAFEAGLSMAWVSDLCCTPLFYHRCGASYRPLVLLSVVRRSCVRHLAASSAKGSESSYSC